MALAVDTKHLLAEMLPIYENSFNHSLSRADRSAGRRFQLHRVCVYATVTHDAASHARFRMTGGYFDPKQEAALDWQAEQGDDEDELEVLHHLKHVAATTTKRGRTRPGIGGVESTVGSTTLVASVQSPTFTSRTQHRPPSSFHRYSTRFIQETYFRSDRAYYGSCTDLSKVIPNFRFGTQYGGVPRIFTTNSEACHYSVIWVVQLDFFDLCSQGTYSPSSPRKRRRTPNPFHRVTPRLEEDHTARTQDHPAPEAKRFKGVRYRPDHNRWVAEMKPPKSKNKVSFGEFRSQTGAARVVDVAFFHYGRPLNFPDSTPHILSSLPPCSTDLSAEAKLELVRNQTEWMKSRVLSLPAPNRSTSDTNSGLRPFSSIGSSLILVGSDEADDAVSQPQSGWLEALVSSVGMAEGQETWGVADGSGDGPQSSAMQWNVETAMARDPSDNFAISPEHFGGTLPTVASSQVLDFGGSSLGDSTAPPLFPMWSPGASQIEVVDGSWEQEIAVVGRGWADQLQA